MPEFSLTTTWSIPASLETVWSCLTATEQWPTWWRYVLAVEQLDPGDATGIGNVRRYEWRTCLPYRLLLTIRTTGILPLERVTVEVSGDLQGTGYCQFLYQPPAATTQVIFQWNVRTCKPWMDYFTALTRPVYIWNHSRVMQQGEKDLTRYLSARK